uniref:Uncharacterized protein n=1 Tax=Cacopsylla melanoneura TaxID=428564 RepID=A0A8D9A5A1_9HEMI
MTTLEVFPTTLETFPTTFLRDKNMMNTTMTSLPLISPPLKVKSVSLKSPTPNNLNRLLWKTYYHYSQWKTGTITHQESGKLAGLLPMGRKMKVLSCWTN